ncbi:MAG: DEAD/DEAH box helicase family protein, partial [Lachnospiraceae bacterium]|nr:DEAD/DEAH box helicase family protein [Lachnospiraceae bacterium]
MKLQFKKQQYQVDAANSVVNLFIGQNNSERKTLIDRKIKGYGYLEEEVEVYSYGNNTINIGESQLKQNIKQVECDNNLDLTEDANFINKDFLKNFSIEMETGTGKTYTYIKTMYELNKAYGFSKFIVMVPSIAIREGTLKSFQVTEEHFKEQYGKKIRYFVYNTNNSSNIANIKSFSEDNNINVIIMNYQAFNTKSEESRKIYKELDELQSRKPIDIIKMTNPILILDEPQKMGKAE